MKKKNHDRSPDKRNFSIALPLTLIADLERIAAKETRSKNRQIEHFLSAQVDKWKAEHKPVATPMLVGLAAPDATQLPSKAK